METLYRHWCMLRMIPWVPNRPDTVTLENNLRVEGFEVSRRTIQRDLIHLSTLFPIENQSPRIDPCLLNPPELREEIAQAVRCMAWVYGKSRSESSI